MIQLGNQIRLNEKEKDELKELLAMQGKVLGEIKTTEDFLTVSLAALSPEMLDIVELALMETRQKFGLGDE